MHAPLSAAQEPRPSAPYREHLPPGPLRDALVCLWEQEAPRQGDAPDHRILPDACVDIVCIGDRPPLVAGPATRAVIAEVAPGASVVGARLRPGMASAWLGIAAWELRDRDVLLSDLLGTRGHRLGQAVRTADTPAARMRALASFLFAQADAARAPDRDVATAVSRLASDPAARVESLARESALSPRQFLRRFQDSIGYGPKTLGRVLRLQRMIHLAAAGEIRTLAALAAAAGYSDQAHMVRDIGALSGLAPRALLAGRTSTLALSDLFKPPGSEPG